MTTSRARWQTALLTAGVLVLGSIAVVATVMLQDTQPDSKLLIAPTAAEVPAADPEPAPEPEPEPEPEPVQIEGAVEAPEIVDLSTANTGVYQPGSDRDQSVPLDHGAIDAFVTAATRWLDDHLTALGRGQDVEVAGLAGDPAPAMTAILGSADEIDDVTYTVRVGARGVPEWAEIVITVGRADGPTGGVITFVDGGEPLPVAIEVLGEGTAP